LQIYMQPIGFSKFIIKRGYFPLQIDLPGKD
jgi:hypothetical protein